MGKGRFSLFSVSKGTGKGPIFIIYSGKGMGKGHTIFFSQLVDDEDYLKHGWWRSVDDEY